VLKQSCCAHPCAHPSTTSGTSEGRIQLGNLGLVGPRICVCSKAMRRPPPSPFCEIRSGGSSLLLCAAAVDVAHVGRDG
jgi:hypothetical protein